MKKQHLYRLSAILLFLCIFLGIMPRHPLQATAAEAESTFPVEGKIYNITYTYHQGKILREGCLSMYIGLFLENGTQTTSHLDTNGKLSDNDKMWLRLSFSFEKTEDGYYQILPVCMPGRCLQLGVGFRDEPSVAVGIYEGKPEQKWIVTPVENGGYRICSAAYPDAPLGRIDQNIYPTLNDEDTVITFSLEESSVCLPTTRVYVKAPEEWYPGIWVYPSQEDVEYSWHGEAVMEQGKDGWFSFPSPSGTECKIVNHVRKGVGEQHYEEDDVLDIVDTDFSTDKWVVITDDPNVAGDLTYKIYDYNPDEEPLKPGQAYTISIGWPLSIMPEKGLQGTNLMVGGQGNLSFSFYFDKTKDGYYTISPASMPGWRLQLSEGKIITEKPQDIPEQKWSIVACDNGYTISSAADPTLFIGKTTPPDDHNQESGDLALSAEPDHKVWKIKESPLTFSEHSVYVKAPEHWAPGLLGDYGSWCVGIMEKQANGWFSFPLYPYQPEYYRCRIMNYMVDVWSSQYGVPDSGVDLYQLESDKDYWVVISDDPYVDGDLTYKIYDHNPDEESPKTADPVMLVIPAIGLLASAAAILWLISRKQPA